MGAGRLIGITVAAAHVAAEARGNADALAVAHDAMDMAFADLNGEEATALGAAAGVLLERHARATGNWGPWAEVWWNAGLQALHEAAAGFRARLDADINRRGEWERKMRQAQAERAETELRRVVRPLMHRGASKAEIEESAGAYAEALGWNRVFSVLVTELDAFRQRDMGRG